MLRERNDLRAGRKLYSTARWRRLAREVFERDGYICQQTGLRLTGKHPAPNSPVCDHIRAHKGDPALFWDPDNLQTVSKAWHDSQKQRQERAEHDRGARYGAGNGETHKG